LALLENTELKGRKIRYWAQDETRIGLKTITGKVLTAKGIKPIGNYQWVYEYLWLYGLIEAETGESFFYEFSHLDSTCMECFLELFSQQYPHDLHIIQLDNGPLHQSFQMSIPANIILVFQPPYSPELNPIERLWEEIKKELRWLIFNNLDELREQIKKILNNLSESTIKSLGGWDFILQALSLVRFRQAIFFSE
jgi:transposase